MRRVLTATTLLFLILLAGIFIYIKNNSTPVSSNSSNTMFMVNSGESLLKISSNLKSKSIIKDQYAFLFYAYYLGLNKKIQAGTYRLSPSLSTPEIITKLSSGGVADYWLKIIDGSRTEEFASLFPQNTSFEGKEGYLFPDSYLIPQYYTSDQIFDVIQKNFNEKFTQAKEGAINTQMTDRQILILASIIEREARTLKVKQGVAGVILNRIKIGMPLQSDTTIQYIRDNLTKPDKYWQDINASDISLVSPYNTYKNKGLPPSPICNPGYDSIYAAFHPTESDYLFYLTGNDGVMYYAQTLEEHNANIEKYLK